MTIEEAFAAIKDCDLTNAQRDAMRSAKAQIMDAHSAVQLAKTAIHEISKGGPAPTLEASAGIVMDTLLTMITLAFLAGKVHAKALAWPDQGLDPPPGKVRVN